MGKAAMEEAVVAPESGLRPAASIAWGYHHRS